MIRTRDFLLFLTIVSFLLIAISSLLFSDTTPSGAQTASVAQSLPASTETEALYTATVPVSEVSNQRKNRLSAMRESVSNGSETVADLPVALTAVTEVEPITTEVSEPPAPTLASNTPLYCHNVENYAAAWEPKGIKFALEGGGRVVYREVEVPTAVLLPETESFAYVMNLTREVVLELPIRISPVSSPSCLPSDVVGLALDGSLIRNSELRLYSIFNDQTLLGYALDGFPIYGQNNGLQLDECGGLSQDGSYRYYLSSDREQILHCFSGVPVAF